MNIDLDQMIYIVAGVKYGRQTIDKQEQAMVTLWIVMMDCVCPF